MVIRDGLESQNDSGRNLDWSKDSFKTGLGYRPGDPALGCAMLISFPGEEPAFPRAEPSQRFSIYYVNAYILVKRKGC